MVYRNSWLAGFAALTFAFVQVNGLIQPTVGAVPWQYIVLAALVLGVIITWTALTYRLKTWIVVLVNAVIAVVAAVRVATPETTSFFLPTLDSFSRLTTQLRLAQRLIRTGVEPVVPDAGIVVVVMLVLWAAGALLAWGLLRGRPYVALLPPLALSLQFATMNRQPTSGVMIATFIALVALIIFAITADERDQTSGRMAPRGQWASDRNRPGPAAAALLGITVVGSVFVANTLDDSVPHDGILDWRVDNDVPGAGTYGYGDGISYNAFIGISQRLVNGSQTPVFFANIISDVPSDEVRFQFMTLESYNGNQFSVYPGYDFVDLDDPVWQRPGHEFAGPTVPLATIVAIDQLQMEWLPTPAVPWNVEGLNGSFEPYLKVRPEDGAILYRGGLTERDKQYRVDSDIPRADINVLATNQATGELSISFRAAQADGKLPSGIAPQAPLAPVREAPPDAERFLDLPRNDLSARIREVGILARDVVGDLETEFEKGLALETFLHSFTYTTDIPPGQSAQDLAAWLLDEDSDNYQTGYCENFATAMAVMARTLGIHSRVVLGFTPGERSLYETNTVVVRDRNAHAWVELWMPSQGWVSFDPTPRSDRINPSTASLIEDQMGFALTDYLAVATPESQEEGGGGFIGILEEPDFLDFLPRGGGGEVSVDPGFTFPNWARWALPPLGLILVLGVGIPVFKNWRHRRRLRRLRHGDITAAWEDLVDHLGDLGQTVSSTHTPGEVATAVGEAMAPLAFVYGKAVYGRPRDLATADDVAIAEDSLLATRDHLISVTPRRRRVMARYRPGVRFRPRRSGRGRSK